MASTNLLNCQTRAGNTGPGRCTQGVDVEAGGYLVPRGTVLDAAFLSDLKTNIAAKLHHNEYTQRWHQLPRWADVVPQDEEAQVFTYPDGSKTTTRDGYYSTRYRYLPDDCMHTSLRQFNGRESQFDYLAVDKSGRLVVVNKTDANGIQVLGATALSRIYAPNKTKATMTEPGGYWLELDMADATEYNENYATVLVQDKFGKKFNPLTFGANQGVQDVTISNVTPLTAGVVTLLFGAGCSQVSMGESLTIPAGAIIAKNGATFATITVTSLTDSPAGKGLKVLTMDTTDTDYPAPGGTIILQMPSVSALTAMGLSYYESNILTLTV
jgi:hypothetical protein